MTQAGAGLQADALSSAPGTAVSPVPLAQPALARARGLWVSRGTSPAQAGCQLAMGHVSHSAFACASLGTASPGLACPPGLGPAALQHLSWPQGCPCRCPCCVALPCPQGSATWGALHPTGTGVSPYCVPLNPKTTPPAALPVRPLMQAGRQRLGGSRAVSPCPAANGTGAVSLRRQPLSPAPPVEQHERQQPRVCGSSWR